MMTLNKKETFIKNDINPQKINKGALTTIILTTAMFLTTIQLMVI